MSSPMTGVRVRGSGGGVVIRRATAADARPLTRMVRTSGAYEGHYASVVAGVTVGRDYIEAQQVHVAVGADGARLGFYALLTEAAELDLLFVADRAQGLGVGRLLIAHMADEARRHGLDTVRVVSHPPAEGFYRAMGAERTGTAPPNPPAVAWPRPELRFRIPAAG